MKNCHSCGHSKELSEFYKHPQMQDGHLNICKPCVCGRVAKYSKTPKGVASEKRRQSSLRRKEWTKLHNKQYKELHKYEDSVRKITQKAIKMGLLEK